MSPSQGSRIVTRVVAQDTMVEDDTRKADFVSSFSPGASFFAFQTYRSQKNSIDLYPLSDIANLQITSSQTLRIDYENNDLNVSDIKLLTWCSGSQDNSDSKPKSVKRKAGNEIELKRDEQFFVNVFPQGKIVVYSSNGKDILNIIQNKREINGIDANGDIIWILDDDKTVKRFNYSTTRPLQTFHLVDGKSEEILNFQVLPFKEKTLLSLITEQFVYIIDPSKKRPTTASKINHFGSMSCTIFDDDHIILSDLENLSLIAWKDGTLIRSWKVEAEKVKVFGDTIVAIDVSGKLNVFNSNSDTLVATVQVENSEILDFDFRENSIILAWVDVNEPRFEVITETQLKESSEFVFNQVARSSQNSSSPTSVSEKEEPEKKKASKKEQDELAQKLLNELSVELLNEEGVLKLLQEESWNEHTIQTFVRDDLDEDKTNRLFEVLSKFLTESPSKSGLPSVWLKWLLIVRRSQIKMINSNTNKTVKRLRSALRVSSESYGTLLSIQGKLEMLNGQALLRKQLSTISLADEEAYQLVSAEEDNESFLYENGEADELKDESR